VDPLSHGIAGGFQQLVDQTLAEQDRGESVAFATVERISQRVIGSRDRLHVDCPGVAVDSGQQGAKSLMLRHAFEI